MKEHRSNSTFARQAMAALALAVTTSACVKSQMATPEAIRTRQGDKVLSIETMQVQTDTGAPGLCLYTASGTGREHINKQVLLPGELTTALETSPGFDDIRPNVMAEVMRPVTIVAQGLMVGLAGRGLADISQQGLDAERFAKNLIKVQTLDAQLSERLVSRLTQAGYRFGPGDDYQVAGKALEDLRNRRISSSEFIQRLDETLQVGSADPQVARYRDIMGWARSRSVTLSALKTKLDRPSLDAELDKLLKSFRLQMPEAAQAQRPQQLQAPVRPQAAALPGLCARRQRNWPINPTPLSARS